MYGKILVCLDGSERAEKILPHVEALALSFLSQVVFLEVVHPIIVDDGYKAVLITETQIEMARQIDESRDYLMGVAGKFREKKIETKVLVEIGSVVNIILTVAATEGVDLIAMTSHGRTGLSRVFYGSIAAGVLNMVDRPLLLIRARSD